MDLSVAVTELEKFKKVDFLSNYTLLDFDLDNPLSLSRFITGGVCWFSVHFDVLSHLLLLHLQVFQEGRPGTY
jgi:hypothetical protein